MFGWIIVTIAIGLCAMLAGLFLGSALVEHAMRTLGAAEWIAYKQAKERVFGPVMPPLFGIGLLSAVAAAVISRASPAAAIVLLAVLAITAIVHLPLNARIMAYAPAEPPAGWSAVRGRWRRWNWVRTGLAIAAALLMVMAR